MVTCDAASGFLTTANQKVPVLDGQDHLLVAEPFVRIGISKARRASGRNIRIQVWDDAAPDVTLFSGRMK